MSIYAQRIENLRSLMRSRGWDAVIMTGSDPHGSEYPAARWKQVEWLSGFTGEAGDLAVTLDEALLWTDSRYFIQAVEQLEGSGVQLQKTGVEFEVSIPDYLEAQSDSPSDYVVAFDSLCLSAAAAEKYSRFNLVGVPDLLSLLWKDRPALIQTPVFMVEPGENRRQKFAWLRDVFSEQGCDGILLSALDDIAWTLNVRASDIEYNPMVISYLLVTRDGAQWFVQKGDVEDPDTLATFAALEDEGVRIMPYDALGFDIDDSLTLLWADLSTLNYQTAGSLRSAGIGILDKKSPVQLRKAVKNPVEIEGMKAAHLRDGLAMECFLYWLEDRIRHEFPVSERDAAIKLNQLRSLYDEFTGESFATISAYGPSAALPHYITPSSDAPMLEAEGLYLCDSGGQYTDGTTDITRTVPLGKCSRLQMEDYTLVLKGHIDLAMAVFPSGTAGAHLDVLARGPLWLRQRTYGHGTGHGVGWFLSCHEGPQNFRRDFNSTPLLPGMITSDEPGIYREGQYGIRHENLLLCVEAGSNDFGRWFKFEPLTLCHFDTSIILKDLLTPDEIAWLNAYNERVFQTLSPQLPSHVSAWLREKTRPLC